ncbi:hypothetical protein [Pseudomonas syringae group genomosp. 7]|uniref:hypothetical protein n=1 Tax=Pseudomonas syringae group genomosp. 7 TaxID=251699 RepID=UPI00376FA8DD
MTRRRRWCCCCVWLWCVCSCVLGGVCVVWVVWGGGLFVFGGLGFLGGLGVFLGWFVCWFGVLGFVVGVLVVFGVSVGQFARTVAVLDFLSLWDEAFSFD